MNRYTSTIGFGVLFLVWAYTYTTLVAFMMKAVFFTTIAGAIAIAIMFRKKKTKKESEKLNTALKGAMLCRMERTRHSRQKKGKNWKG